MKNQDLTNYLKSNQFYVLSPHLDDAILSMGMLLYQLKKSCKGTVINCFTKANNSPYTLSARQFLRIVGYKSAKELYADRIKEDKKALGLVGVKHLNLDLTDALFRRHAKSNFLGKYIAEFNHLYPTYRWHVTGKINPTDQTPEELETKLQKIVKKNALVFAPFGIGNHVDHVIVNKIAAKLFKNLIYYIDFPYNIRSGYSGKRPKGYKNYELPIDLKTKSMLISAYPSQINSLFKNGVVPDHQEKFFVPINLIK